MGPGGSLGRRGAPRAQRKMAYVKLKNLTAGDICTFTLLRLAARFKFNSAVFVLHVHQLEYLRARARDLTPLKVRAGRK